MCAITKWLVLLSFNLYSAPSLKNEDTAYFGLRNKWLLSFTTTLPSEIHLESFRSAPLKFSWINNGDKK